MKVIGLSGSLRAGSYNTMLLENLGRMLPDEVAFAIHDYRDVPLYNDDDDETEAVVALKAAIAAADAVVIASPEYNHGVPGVLKNALDWASRPAFRSVFAGKPTGVMSASPGMVGGARGQQHLKVVLMGMGTPVFPWPEFLLGRAATVFEGRVITDEVTLGFLRKYVDGFVAWAQRNA